MAARPTLAIGALRTSGDPVLKGSGILWDIDTGLSTTDAHVILDCGMSNGTLDPEAHGVALGVGSADADIVWLWTACIVNISYPPSNDPQWLAKIGSWCFTIAPGSLKLDLAVLQVQGHLNGGPSKPLNESFADRGLGALPLGDSDLAQVGSAVRVYGFGQSSSHRTQRAMITGGIISRKTDDADGCCVTITIDAAILGGHSGGMLLDSAGEVIGWCVWSQTDKVFGGGSLSAQPERQSELPSGVHILGGGSLSVPSGANDVRPINLLRPALEAALVAIDPSRTGVALTEKLRGAVPLRPVQDQANRRASQADATSTAMGLSQVGDAAAMTSLSPDGIALQVDDHKRQRFRSLPQDVTELSLAAPLLDGVPNLPEQYESRPVLEKAHREALLRTKHTMAITATTTGVSGPAGAGKSTTAAVLARDPLVHAHFPDGITWLSFGRERTGADVLRTLATSILRLDSALSHEQLPRAISVALTGQRRLLVLDDIWTKEQLKAFASLAAEGGLLDRLVTTRNNELAGEHAQTVDALQEEEALRVFAGYVGKAAEQYASEESRSPGIVVQLLLLLRVCCCAAAPAPAHATPYDDEDVRRLVDMCSGNPAMLRSVAVLCKKKGAAHTRTYLEQCRKKMRHAKLPDAGEQYGTLFDALAGSLDHLESELAERCRMLATFPEDMRVPWSVVGQLWDTDALETEEALTELESWHLVDVDWDKCTISLIDLHLDYLRASAKDDLARWHAALLRGCGRRKLGEDQGTAEDRSADDRYWGRSQLGKVEHHLRGCGWEPTTLDGELTHLTLKGEGIDDEDVKALSDAITVSGSLTTLVLFGNTIGTEGGVALAEALKVNGSLKSLNLAANDIGLTGFAAIAKALAVNGSLTCLYLGGNNLGDAGAAAIADGLRVSGTLTELSFYGNGNIGEPGATAVAEALRINGSLTTLDLGDNNLGDAGAAAIADALRVSSSLKSLQIMWNKIGPKGGAAVAEALKTNGSLTMLSLDGNEIGPEGGVAFAGALRVNGSLTSLDLFHDKIGDTGAAAIAEALKINGSLTSLLLGGNEFGHKATETLKEAVRHARLSVFV